jgi:Chaperone of endosialidase
MANRTRRHANFATGNNIFVDTVNSRVGVGTTVPSTTLQVSGTITCTDINSTSDIKLKENIHSIDNPLDKVMQINGVGFRWKDTKENSFGVIAQDIEEVLPELVKENDHHKSVNYNGLIGVLIEAVKEQQRQILELKAQLNDK